MHFNVSLHIALSPSEAVSSKALANIYISKFNRGLFLGVSFLLPFRICPDKEIIFHMLRGGEHSFLSPGMTSEDGGAWFSGLQLED